LEFIVKFAFSTPSRPRRRRQKMSNFKGHENPESVGELRKIDEKEIDRQK